MVISSALLTIQFINKYNHAIISKDFFYFYNVKTKCVNGFKNIVTKKGSE